MSWKRGEAEGWKKGRASESEVHETVVSDRQGMGLDRRDLDGDAQPGK